VNLTAERDFTRVINQLFLPDIVCRIIRTDEGDQRRCTSNLSSIRTFEYYYVKFKKLPGCQLIEICAGCIANHAQSINILLAIKSAEKCENNGIASSILF